jgi:transcriptional regulator with XRE-family HTH domain
MGRGVRWRPEYLGKKCGDIRVFFGLSQTELIERLGLVGHVNRSEISDFERDVREPDLKTLKAYAELAGVYVDDLIDDSVDLPREFPADWRVERVKRRQPTRKVRAPANKTLVILLLMIESAGQLPREESRARMAVEKSHLNQYQMKKLSDTEYELVFSHVGEEDLDEQVYALLRDIKTEAGRNNCSVKIAAREKGADRYW